MTGTNSTHPAVGGAAWQSAASYGVNTSAQNSSAVPAKNPVGTVAFALAIVMLVIGSTFALMIAVFPTPIEQLRLILLVQAATGVLLSLVVVVLATVSLVLKNRRRMLGAIALGAGGYTLLATILSFLSNAIATAFG